MNSFIRDHLNEIKKQDIPNPELELRVLLNNCSINNKEVFLNNLNIDMINIEKFKSIFQRRINHEPFSKIINKKEFWSLDFYVNRHVLDPRPASEFLIQTIKGYFTDMQSNIKICDLGTGSGCLAVTLATIYKNQK